jgi:hypothetical protein
MASSCSRGPSGGRALLLMLWLVRWCGSAGAMSLGALCCQCCALLGCAGVQAAALAAIVSVPPTITSSQGRAAGGWPHWCSARGCRHASRHAF